MPTYLIEHLEAKLYPWCLIEYKHISQMVGKKNLLFTNIRTPTQRKKLEPLGMVHHQRAAQLNLPRACLLDPEAKQELKPADAKLFDTFIFGGILGDHPMQGRTKKELHLPGTPRRNLGSGQFPTDNAIYVVKEIVENRQLLKNIPVVDDIEVPLRPGESIEFPFRYATIAGKPLVSPALVEYLKRRKTV